MKIENLIIQFHPDCIFENLNLTDLQKQYLADLRAQNSIQSLVERYLNQGWLVNFLVLFDLIAMLSARHWILNPEINTYFKNINSNIFNSQRTDQANLLSQKLDIKKLQQLPFFRSLPEKLSLFLLQKAKLFEYQPESLICKQGETSRDLYVLIDGEAAVYTVQAERRQFISILNQGSVFGEAGFLLNSERSADVMALKRSQILVIPYQVEILDQFLNIEKAEKVQQRFWVQHALLHSDFFKTIPTDCFDAMTFSGKIINFENQKILFKQNDASRSAYIVIQGSVVVQKNGKTINTLSQGSLLGEVSLILAGGLRSATAICQKGTKLLEIDHRDFYSLLAHNLYLAKEFQLLADQRLINDKQRNR